MGNAKRRGTYAERVALALGNSVSNPHEPPAWSPSQNDGPLMPDLLRDLFSRYTPAKKPRSWFRRITLGRANDSKRTKEHA